jgi:hypothetical protein
MPCVFTLPLDVQVAVAPVTEAAKVSVSPPVLSFLAAITNSVPTGWLVE